MVVKPVIWTRPLANGQHDIKLYLSAGRKKKYRSTGVRVYPKDWDDNKKLVRRSDPLHASKNGRIESMRIELASKLLGGTRIEQLGEKKSNSLMDWLDQLIAEIEGGKTELSPGTGRKYGSLRTRLREWLDYEQRSDILFEEVDMTFYYSYRDYLIDECGVQLNGGFSGQIKTLKAAMNYARDRGLHNHNGHEHRNFKRHRKGDSGKIYLKQDEIDAMAGLDLADNPVMARERDRFLLSFYLILRYGDSTNIRRNHFTRREGRLYYTNIAEKTGAASAVPVKPLVEEILERYDYNLDFNYNAAANKSIKMVAAMAGINEIVTENDRRGPKSQFVTTHTARRSAATLLRLSGMPLTVLQDLGGWKH
ncbi:MAG: phage integrase SAM-like domain-containing protein, partial [Bacteroidota bacterium]